MTEPLKKGDSLIRMWMTTTLISLVGGVLIACMFIYFLDHEPSSDVLFLPGVFPVAVVAGLVAGVCSWPAVHFALRKTKLSVSVPILYLLTILGSVLFSQSLFGPPVSLAVALIFCWRMFPKDVARKTELSLGG